MNIINLGIALLSGLIGVLIASLCEELTGEPIFYWILLPFCFIRDYILYPIAKPKRVIWLMKHHINYFRMAREDLYELDNDAWNEFLMLFVKPDKRKEAGYDRNFHLAIKSGLNSEKAYYECKVLQPIRDLLIKGDKKDEN